MRKFLNIAIAFMLLLAPLVNFDNSVNTKMSSNLEFFGSQAGDDCENETKDEDLPYYVNKDSGSDDNVGSEDCPFATISKAAESITDGDTVIISHGIYRESVSIDGIEDVTFRAAEGSKVVIDGSSDIEDDMDFISRLCNPVIVMAEGSVLFEGTSDEVKKNEKVIESYLGRGSKIKEEKI